MARSLALLAVMLISSAAALAPPPRPWRGSMSRRPVVQQAFAAALVLPSAAANAATKKPDLKAEVKAIDASIPKEERNIAGDKSEHDDEWRRRGATHFPKISFEGPQGQGKKVVFTVPYENLTPPDFSYIELMWIKDEGTGEILTAKKFRASDPSLVITAFGSTGQKLTAASKDDKLGVWQGTFIVP